MLSYDDKSHYYRDAINVYCKNSLLFRYKVRRYKKVYACNYETAKCLPGSSVLPDVSLNNNMRHLIVNRTYRDKVIILYCGRLINKKGLMFLLDVVNLIPKSYPFEVWIYGEGNQKKELQDRIHQLALENIVSLKGFIPYTEMSNVYEKADIFVLPSLRESGGSVLIEAMAHGLPIVSLNMALSKLLDENNAGLFVNVNNSKETIINSFANNLITLIRNEELRTQLGHNGYKYVNSKYTWDIMINEVYGNILNNYKN